jgi:hypothetical protein
VLDQYREAKAAEESQKWISAAEAVQLLQPVFNSEYRAKMTICRRAHVGLIRARAERFIADKKESSDFEIPKGFWWAKGQEALHQNWPIGDFDTWVNNGNLHLQAFGVSFSGADIEHREDNPGRQARAGRACSCALHL